MAPVKSKGLFPPKGCGLEKGAYKLFWCLLFSLVEEVFFKKQKTWSWFVGRKSGKKSPQWEEEPLPRGCPGVSQFCPRVLGWEKYRGCGLRTRCLQLSVNHSCRSQSWNRNWIPQKDSWEHWRRSGCRAPGRATQRAAGPVSPRGLRRWEGLGSESLPPMGQAVQVTRGPKPGARSLESEGRRLPIRFFLCCSAGSIRRENQATDLGVFF